MKKRSAQASLVVLLLGATFTAYGGDMSGLKRATFAVHCYDVGAHALRDQPGVITIQRGWQGREEVDRVLFDPARVTLTELEEQLKRTHTYIRTISIDHTPENDGENEP